jgi:hypothetical protein
MKFVFVAMFLVGALGLSKLDAAPPASAPSAPTAEAADQAVPAGVLGGPSTSAICPQKWTCNYRSWYSTEAACTAGCTTGACFLDYRCTGGCVCP